MTRDLLRRGHTPQRALVADRIRFGPVQVGIGHVGIDPTGCDRAYDHSVRGQRLRHRLAESVEPGLAGPVGRGVGLAPEGPA